MNRRNEHQGVDQERGDETPAGGEDQALPDGGPRRSFFFRLQKSAHRKFPDVVPDPELGERLVVWRQRDAESNSKSAPPPDEVIDLRCVWAVEVYTPSQIGALLRGFEKLGWDTGDPLSANRNPALWIQHNRESASGGGWMNLGVIRRPGAPGFLSHAREAPLPAGVDYALAGLYSLTSSLTCLVVCFVVDESRSRCLEHTLRKERETYAVHERGGYRIIGPVNQKEDDVRLVRDEVRQLATGWLSNHLPGLFASGILAGEFPTCEFLTLRNRVPFPPHDQRDHKRENWLRILDIDNNFRAWHGDDPPGLKFLWPLTRDRSNRFHAVIAARERDFSEELLQTYGGKDRDTIVYHVDEYVNGLLSRWALVGVLSGFERYLNNVRDSAAFNPSHRAKPLELLRSLGGYLAQSIDISAASAELRKFAEHRGLFNYPVADFYPCDTTFHGDEKIAFGEVLRQQIGERAEWLRNTDRSVRDILNQYGTTFGNRENIKLQRRIAVLTWLIVALTVAIAALTALTVLPAINTGNLSWPW